MEKSLESTRKSARLIFGILWQVVIAVLCFFSALIFVKDAFREGYLLAITRLLYAVGVVLLSAVFYATLRLSRRSVVWIIGPMAGFAAAASIGFSWQMAVLWVFFLAASEVLLQLTLHKCPRIPFAVTLSALVALSLLACFSIHFYERFGDLSLGRILAFVQERLLNFVDEFAVLLRTVEAETGTVLFSAQGDFAEKMYNAVLLSLPGLFLTTVFFVAYVATYVFRLFLSHSGVRALLYPDGFYPTPSLVTAVLYAVCILYTSLFSGTTEVLLFAVVSNLEAVLQLLFCFVGLSVLTRPRKNRAHRKPSFLPFFLVCAVGTYLAVRGVNLIGALLVVGMAFSAAFPLLSFVGLFSTIFQLVREKRQNTPSDSQKGM